MITITVKNELAEKEVKRTNPETYYLSDWR
ncbi:MAG: hypothetical protein JWO03_2335 [Bacteroidetes bacterium]|nr:hypothetical protein [Bacteroidota bacterium]